MLTQSQHVDDVGQEHEADDGEKHQYQDVQHDEGDAEAVRSPERRNDGLCVRRTADLPRLFNTAVRPARNRCSGR